MSTKEILNRLSANPVTSRILSEHLYQARRKNLDPVLIVGDRRVHLTTRASGKRGTMPVKYVPFW